MQRDKSKNSTDGQKYDQAVEDYNAISRRRKSRFLSNGILPGILCLVSSRRYPGQFTDRKEEERRKQLVETGSTTIFLYDKKVWEIKPAGTYCGKTFRIFVGDYAQQPMVLDEDEDLLTYKPTDIIEVPIEYRQEFEDDIVNALRDNGGLSTFPIHPFFTNRDAVASCFGGHNSILTRDVVTWPGEKIDKISYNIYQPNLLRFAHLDLSKTVDATGIVVGCVSHFDQIDRGGVAEILPHIRIDFSLRVLPPKGGEILYDDIREFIYWIRRQGINLHFVTADSFQSSDTIQLLSRKGL